MSLLVPTLMRLAFHGMLRSRRAIVIGLVCLIPILLGVALIFADAEQATYARANGTTYFQSNLAEPLAYLIVGATVPFLAMLLAGSIVADEVEDRTFSYILVRPLRRSQVYLSRLLPAAILAAALAAFQALAFSLLRLLSWSLHGQGATESFRNGTRNVTYASGDVILAQGAMGLLAAALAAVGFLCLFAFVTVLTTRYHFLANVILFAAVELLFGNLGGQGAGILTITYHARSLLYVLGGETGYHAAPWWVAAPALLAMAALWTWLATHRMGRRDFNVASAAA